MYEDEMIPVIVIIVCDLFYGIMLISCYGMNMYLLNFAYI